MESSVCIVSEIDVRRENQFETYDHDQGSFNLEFLMDSLKLDRVVPQLLVILIQLASFKNMRREVL
jgi:hypothetical protein